MTVSQQLYAKALQLIPGGVNSPARSFQGVGGVPVFFKQGKGAYVTDVDGKEYIDYIGSWGPLILGHCHPKVIAAITEVLHQGVSFGAPTELEIQLAAKVISLMPSIEKIRMVNSGTEATMTAIRLARGYTGRSKIIKYNGCYHGHTDALLVEAGSGLLTMGKPSSAGIPIGVTENTLTADYNNLQQTSDLFKRFPKDIAAVIVEPIAGNMGFVLPNDGFLQGLRALCDSYGAVLIFDEVMTGFRVALGGAQAVYGIKPDLTTLGKIIGGGLPVGAIGGKAAIMDCLSPLGGVYQAGTLSGNPLAMAAGLATLSELEQPGLYEGLQQLSTQLVSELADVAKSYAISFHGQSLGGMFGFCFSEHPVHNLKDVVASNEPRFVEFFHAMLQEGIYFAPSRFEAGFISSMHTHADIQSTIRASKKVFSSLLK